MINYCIGLSLGANSSIESGVVVRDLISKKLIYIDKLFSMNDISFFFDNYTSINNSIIIVSLPWDNTMLEGKWRVQSKAYQQLNTANQMFLNRDNWMQKFSTRGCDLFLKLKEHGNIVYRYEIYLTRLKLNLYSNYKERSSKDCKFLQDLLKVEYGFDELPQNMMPMAQLEAIVGTLLADDILSGNVNKIFEYKNLDVINRK